MRVGQRRNSRSSGWLLAAAWAAASLAVMLLLPAVLVDRFEPDAPRTAAPPLRSGAAPDVSGRERLVPVWITERGVVDEMPLEDYVRGVVAAEMPADFEPEALKAQAIAARTYAMRRLEAGTEAAAEPGADGPAAPLTDTIVHQSYAADSELRARWGDAYERHLDKLTRAVEETSGLILTYGERPIEATFFSASNGYTENSEAYWQTELPYLRSVPSPWDERHAPDFERTTAIGFGEFYRRLGLPAASAAPDIELSQTSDSGRVLEVRVDGKALTGRDVRERLGLASTDFVWKIADGSVIFKTEGNGHGVGLSQWGAQGMAKEGYTAEEIVLYYYRGATLEKVEF